MSGLLVHDWIERIGGSELVLAQMQAEFPDAEVFTLWNNQPSDGATRVTESVLARTPFRGRKALALPLMPLIWRTSEVRKQSFDWVLVSSHALAHQIRVATGTPKLVYAHTPARYLWEPDLDPRGRSPLSGVVAAPLRRIDRHYAREAVAVACNSSFVRERIMRTWRRDATVVYPPVRVELIQSIQDWSTQLSPEETKVVEALPSEFLLGASRFVSYKRLDLVIETARRADLPAVIAGGGPDEKRLRDQAAGSGAKVVFVGNPSDSLLFYLYQRCIAFVFPAVEDFGIMAVEAAAAGARVLAERRGGSSETVLDGETGALADFQSPAEVQGALERTTACRPSDALAAARRFSEGRFRSEIRSWVESQV